MGKIRRSYDAGFKLEVVQYAEDCGSGRAAAAHFAVGESLVRAWWKQKDSLHAVERGRKRVDPIHRRANLLLESQLMEWVDSAREQGIALTGSHIQLQAKRLASALGASDTFKASNGWLTGFKDRNALSTRAMPPTKSNAGKAPDAARGRTGGAACPVKGPLVAGMRNRMSGMRSSGMKQVTTGMKVVGMKGRHFNASKIQFRTVKSGGKKRSPKKISPESILSGNKQQDEALLKLRIPLHICSVLPSIKKFTAKSKATKGQKITNMHFDAVSEPLTDQEQRNPHLFPCIKKRKMDYIKYTITLLKEHRFQGMIWDVAFIADGDIIVTCSEGAMLCDKDLDIKKHFEKMFLPGAIGFLSDGRILIVDRSSDTVNVYRKNATFIRSFLAGKCPMGMVVNAQDEVLVSDTGDKCVRKFDMLGRHLFTIPTKGDEYTLQWPLYLTLSQDQDIFVSDVHQQKVLQFSKDGSFLKVCGLKTQGGSTVLRPHGVCITHDNELVVVDTSIDSVETFLPNGLFQQTLLNPDDGMVLEPKLCKLNVDDNLLVVGGMKGLIRIYTLTVNPPPTGIPDSKSHRAGDAILRRQMFPIKEEIKEEPADDPADDQ